MTKSLDESLTAAASHLCELRRQNPSELCGLVPRTRLEVAKKEIEEMDALLEAVMQHRKATQSA